MADIDTTTTAADAHNGTTAGAAATDTDITAAAASESEAAVEAAPAATNEPPLSPSSPSSTTAPSPPPNPHPPPATPPSFLEGVLTLALPAPNAPPPVAPPISPASAAAAASRRIPPPCWTHEETLALIDAYGAKWAALRRGNLRTTHWEEVAGDLQDRTRDLPGAKTKTAMQCRHKIEKLRKRYRSERQRSLKSRPGEPPSSSWVYFRRMDALEFGGGPNPGLAPPARRPPNQGQHSEDEDEVPSESEEDGEDDAGGGGNHPGIRDPAPRANGIGNGPSPLRIRIPKATRTNRTGGITNEGAFAALARTSFPSLPSISSNGRTRFLGKFPGSRPQFLHNETGNRTWEGSSAEKKNKKGKRAREEEEEDQEPVRGRTASILEKVVAAVRMIGDGFMRMEQMKMDMTREFERARMDMELKHTEMMLQSQRRILDFMIKGITGSKKRKMPPEA